MPWIHQDLTAAHANPTAAFIHPQLTATAVQKAATAATALDPNSLAAACHLANLGVLNYGITTPAQSFDMVLPFFNGQPIDGRLIVKGCVSWFGNFS